MLAKGRDVVPRPFSLPLFTHLPSRWILGSSLPASNAKQRQATANIRYLGDVLERTSLIRYLLIQAGRGLEPRLGKERVGE